MGPPRRRPRHAGRLAPRFGRSCGSDLSHQLYRQRLVVRIEREARYAGRRNAIAQAPGFPRIKSGVIPGYIGLPMAVRVVAVVIPRPVIYDPWSINDRRAVVSRRV